MINLLEHYWIPLVIAGLSGMAALIRTVRANLLDELHKPYVTAARARGLSERKLVWEYPVRVALNPFVSSAGFELPNLISGFTVIGIVLSLPMHGPLLYHALQSQDMYLAGAYHPAAQHAHRRRRPYFGHRPCVARPAHPLHVGRNDDESGRHRAARSLRSFTARRARRRTIARDAGRHGDARFPSPRSGN